MDCGRYTKPYTLGVMPQSPILLPPNLPLITIIQSLGLTANLELCLDAGDVQSYAGGSGQSWLDRSGNGFDFFRGATGGAEASDPTFNGTAGRLSSSEYWSVDGGDFFRYDTTNETWMQNIHKDNALFTLMAWIYIVPLAVDATYGVCGSGQTVGFNLRRHTTGGNGALIAINDGAVMVGTDTLPVPPDNAWAMLSCSVDEAAATGLVGYNGNHTSFTSTYTTPSTGNSSFTMEIGAVGGAVHPLITGSRTAEFAAWEGVALTASQLNSLYQATRGRFGV